MNKLLLLIPLLFVKCHKEPVHIGEEVFGKTSFTRIETRIDNIKEDIDNKTLYTYNDGKKHVYLKITERLTESNINKIQDELKKIKGVSFILDLSDASLLKDTSYEGSPYVLDINKEINNIYGIILPSNTEYIQKLYISDNLKFIEIPDGVQGFSSYPFPSLSLRYIFYNKKLEEDNPLLQFNNARTSLGNALEYASKTKKDLMTLENASLLRGFSIRHPSIERNIQETSKEERRYTITSRQEQSVEVFETIESIKFKDERLEPLSSKIDNIIEENRKLFEDTYLQEFLPIRDTPLFYDAYIIPSERGSYINLTINYVKDANFGESKYEYETHNYNKETGQEENILQALGVSEDIIKAKLIEAITKKYSEYTEEQATEDVEEYFKDHEVSSISYSYERRNSLRLYFDTGSLAYKSIDVNISLD